MSSNFLNIYSNILRKRPEKKGQVVGLVNFELYLNTNYIFVSESSDDYVNNKSVDRRRALIAFTQNINIWLFAIKWQILAIFRNERIDNLLANPMVPLSRPRIPAQVLAILCVLFGFIGNLPSLIL